MKLINRPDVKFNAHLQDCEVCRKYITPYDGKCPAGDSLFKEWYRWAHSPEAKAISAKMTMEHAATMAKIYPDGFPS